MNRRNKQGSGRSASAPKPDPCDQDKDSNCPTILLHVKGSFDCLRFVHVDRNSDSRSAVSIFLTHEVALADPAILNAVFALGVIAYPPVTLVIAGHVDQALAAANISLGRTVPAAGGQVDRYLGAGRAACADTS